MTSRLRTTFFFHTVFPDRIRCLRAERRTTHVFPQIVDGV